MAQGVIASVKDPAETIEKVVVPAQEGAAAAGRPAPIILATRWSILAQDEEEAWQAIYPWRGLRAPGRLEAVDPADLRAMADAMPRDEILGRYTVVRSHEDIFSTYRPLVEDLGADIVALQMASLDQPDLIQLLGSDVLPRLRAL